MKEAITVAKQKITEAAEVICQGKKQEGYAKIDEVLVSLINLNQKIEAALMSGAISDYDESIFIGILTEAMKALEAKDMVLLSDILQYDMLEEIEALEQRV